MIAEGKYITAVAVSVEEYVMEDKLTSLGVLFTATIDTYRLGIPFALSRAINQQKGFGRVLNEVLVLQQIRGEFDDITSYTKAAGEDIPNFQTVGIVDRANEGDRFSFVFRNIHSILHIAFG